MEWNRWRKLVTNAHTKDTEVVKQDKPSGERRRARLNRRLRADHEQDVAECSCGSVVPMRYECA